MPAVADVSTAPNAIAGASAAKNRKKTDAYTTRRNGNERRCKDGTVSLLVSRPSPRRGARRFRSPSRMNGSASWLVQNVRSSVLFRKNHGV
jgi:hypothetical protein